jgi:LmbE family N-acetylglucosaminyl deacetylase
MAQSQPLKRKVVLSFVAHPDDAEILCGGTLVRLAESGWETHICSCTPGDCGTMTENRWDISSIRTKENAAAAKLIGATYHCLDERDGFVCYDKPAIQKAIDLFRRIAPTLVIIHAPKDYMMDHEMAHLLGRNASFIYGAPNASPFPRHPESATPYLYYCDPVEGITPEGKPVTPTTAVDMTKQHEKKLEMLACHVSQREWLRSYHGMDEYLEATKRIALGRGKQFGYGAAECFVQHRGHPYPQDDLLAKLFGKEIA